MPSTPELDWNDTTDQANVTRGLIDRLEPCVVRNEAGRVVWDNDRWDFLNKGECPDTVHASLWRQSGLNTTQGLFEVVPGIYQVRGLDVSNMTIIEGRTGLVVVDPLTSKEVAAEALGLKPWVPTLKDFYVEITPTSVSGRHFQFGEHPEREI